MSGRILILDPSCAAAHGHHLTSLLDLIAALKPRIPELAVNAAMPPAAFPDGVVVRTPFTTTVYDEPGLGPRPNGRIERRVWKLRRTLHGLQAATGQAALALSAPVSLAAARRAQDWGWSRWRIKWPTLEAILRESAGAPCNPAASGSAAPAGNPVPVAHIVVPSSDAALICGLAELRAGIPALHEARIHARLITLTPELALLAARGASARYRALVAQRMQGVHLYVETPAMQRHVAETFGLDSDVYPYLLAPQPLAPPPAPRDRFAFGYFGATRNEKGFPRLLPILREVAALRNATDPALSFFVHASDATGSEADILRAAFARIAAPGLDIAFTAGPLSGAAYASHFAAIDATLLPYTGARYGLSGSGILCEAVAYGKAVIYARGLSFADFCTPDTAIAAATDGEFAAAILVMARAAPRFRAGAAAHAVAYALDVTASPLLRRLTLP